MIAATAGLIGAGAAQAAEAEDPHAIGTVAGGKVGLPPLHAASESGGPVMNGDPVAWRLGVAVVGLGHLALAQILPGFGQARSVSVMALVSGHPEKARAVSAQRGMPVAEENG